MVDSGAVGGEVLDVGCGSGALSVYLASQGFSVTGIDLAPTAIAQARQAAEERGVTATFLVGDVIELAGFESRFQTVVDCGMFPSLPSQSREKYAAALRRVCTHDARVHLLTMSVDSRNEVKGVFGRLGMQRRILERLDPPDKDQIRAAFAEHWNLVSMADSVFRVRLPIDRKPRELPAWLISFEPA
ncbi:hypothetical protein AQ490_15875 [Wenjunlia vitaminophila]|uniref:Methyltransferase domain-containing protein n=1 Tax=Wenjunlia vitaminophila TaxID=76728 RepID=A0A0T6LWM5_WENVI|nr:hypothetical protein AQ490_15875 [Wenjunlia vitaminophila]